MKRGTFLIIMLSAAALLFCACSSNEGTMNPTPTGPEDTVFYGVNGHCYGTANIGVNGKICKVYGLSGNQYFQSNVSHTDPLYGSGYYACWAYPIQVFPPDGTMMYVVAFNRDNTVWGVSAPFEWEWPHVQWIDAVEN
jgi:hypothetical protein